MSTMNHLKCPFNHELLSAYASGNSNAQDRIVVERHLANCTHCRREVLELEKSWWALDVWRDVEIPAKPRFDVLKAKIQQNKQPIPLFQRMKPYWRQANRVFARSSKFAAAASVAMIMMVTVMYGGNSDMTNTPTHSRLADANSIEKKQTQPKLVEFVADPNENLLNSKKSDYSDTFVALGDNNNTMTTEGGYTPRSVVPANNTVIAVSYQPTAMNGGVYLGQ